MPVSRQPVSPLVRLLGWFFVLSAAGHIFLLVQRYDYIRPSDFWRIYAPAGLLVLGALLALVIHALWHRAWRMHVIPFLQLTLCLCLLWLAPKLGHQLFNLKDNRTRVHAYEVLSQLETWKNTHGSYPPSLAQLDIPTPILTHTFAPFDYERTSPTNYQFSAQGGRFLLFHTTNHTTHYFSMTLCH